MKFSLKLVAILLFLWQGVDLLALEVTVKTKAPNNPTVAFQYRVPKNYDPDSKQLYRVVVIFGGKNTNGKADASGRMGWGKWADENDIFLFCPGYQDDTYWEPQNWSGKALLNGLTALKKQYKVNIDNLLYYGYSAGSQASNLFPAWKPQLARAWVSHACGVFHEPKLSMKNSPGLVTCGDADKSRYIISLNFVESYRKKNINIIWKSFPNLGHSVPPKSIELAHAFLEFYHKLYSDDLTTRSVNYLSKGSPTLFVGDDQEHKYYPANSPEAKNIFQEDRVLFPNETIAQAWGIASE